MLANVYAQKIIWKNYSYFGKKISKNQFLIKKNGFNDLNMFWGWKAVKVYYAQEVILWSRSGCCHDGNPDLVCFKWNFHSIS